MRRGSRGGGGQAGEEVISPQLAPLPRSLKGRRKPPGPPPRGLVSSVARPQSAPHQSGHQQWVPRSSLGHTQPQSIRLGLRCKSPLGHLPNAFQASVSPSVRQSQGPQLHITGRFGQEHMCHLASAQHQDHLPELPGLSAKCNCGAPSQAKNVKRLKQSINPSFRSF